MDISLKHMIIAMASVSFGVAAGCGSDSPEAAETSSGGEQGAMEASCGGSHDGTAGEASCSGAAEEGAASGEASCGEGSCG